VEVSADNWAVCPNCKAKAEAAHAEAIAEAAAAYGKVPPDEWMAMTTAADRPLVLERTFREDWEIYGAEEAVVTVSYTGRCTVCGSGVKFNTDHPVTLRDGL
jgi:hypothetical protein